MQAFLAWGVEILHFDDGDARVCGKIRAEMESSGNRIGAYDTLLGGQCLRHEFTLVSSNLSEFSRIPGLKCVDWAQQLYRFLAAMTRGMPCKSGSTRISSHIVGVRRLTTASRIE